MNRSAEIKVQLERVPHRHTVTRLRQAYRHLYQLVQESHQSSRAPWEGAGDNAEESRHRPTTIQEVTT